MEANFCADKTKVFFVVFVVVVVVVGILWDASDFNELNIYCLDADKNPKPLGPKPGVAFNFQVP